MNLTPLSRSLSPFHFPLLLPNKFFSHTHTQSNTKPRYALSSLKLNLGFKIQQGRRPTRAIRTRATRRESPYEALGLSPSATPQEIKRAYRKLALKYHPDVNKEANAQEKFMRIKHAYNTLLNSESQYKYDYNNRSSNYSGTSGKDRTKTSPEEEFYGFADFFRDLQTEFENWEADIDSQDKPKSLWEELAVIGEEFVEFLEKELNINDSDLDVGEIFEGAGQEKSETGKDETNKKSSIENSIDDIEAALAQLKKELGL